MAIQIPATRQALATAYKNSATSGAPWLSLHTGAPGADGSANQAGSRVQITWTDGVGGALAATSVNVPVPAGTYKFASLWTAQTGGTCIDYTAINETTLSEAGDINVTPSFQVS